MPSAARDANEPSKSASVAARLRALAQQYGKGQLSRDAYRKLRAPLLDALDGSDTDLQSSTIPHFDPRLRAAVEALPTQANVVAAQEAHPGALRRMLAWMAAMFRR